jgi:hypothetical protein
LELEKYTILLNTNKVKIFINNKYHPKIKIFKNTVNYFIIILNIKQLKRHLVHTLKGLSQASTKSALTIVPTNKQDQHAVNSAQGQLRFSV